MRDEMKFCRGECKLERGVIVVLAGRVWSNFIVFCSTALDPESNLGTE